MSHPSSLRPLISWRNDGNTRGDDSNDHGETDRLQAGLRQGRDG